MSGEGGPTGGAGASSRIPGFFRLDRRQRIEVLRAFAGESRPASELEAMLDGTDFALLDRFVENAVGGFALPLGIATNFLVDGRDLLVPMAIEESSVVAAASNMARIVRRGGGFHTDCVEDLVIGQVQLLDVPDLSAAEATLRERTAQVLALANALEPRLVALGGGARGVELRPFPAEASGGGPTMVVHLLVDCVDAMGANVVCTMCEALAPRLAEWTGARAGLRILSNLADRRRFRAWCRIPEEALALPGTESAESGAATARAMESAFRFADSDPYRATTHNKGVMNGVDAVLVATGNDWRAVEAGVHVWACRDGRCRPVSRCRVDEKDGALEAEIELPLQLGVVGGVTRLHPTARFAMMLLGVRRGRELARVLAAVGLAQNLAALRALATEGIQRGHMRLHERNLELARRMDGEGT